MNAEAESIKGLLEYAGGQMRMSLSNGGGGVVKRPSQVGKLEVEAGDGYDKRYAAAM